MSETFQYWAIIAGLVIAAWPAWTWFRNRTRKLKVSTSPLSWVTLSEPIDIDPYRGCQRIAILLDIGVQNTLRQGVTLDAYHVQYRSHMLKFQNARWWRRFEDLEKHIEHLEFLYQWLDLVGPLPVPSPARIIGENNAHRIMPHRRVNFPDLGIYCIGDYLQDYEANTGVLLFESQGYFWGGARPFRRPNGTVPVRCTVRDLRSVSSSAHMEVRLVEFTLAQTSQPSIFTHGYRESDMDQ